MSAAVRFDISVSMRLLRALSALSLFLISAIRPLFRSVSACIALFFSFSIFSSSLVSFATARFLSVVKANVIAALTPLSFTPFWVTVRYDSLSASIRTLNLPPSCIRPLPASVTSIILSRGMRTTSDFFSLNTMTSSLVFSS